MALTPMSFDRVWTNPVDFPTHETLESKVRSDMQYLFDSIKDQFNNFATNEFTADNMSFAPTEEILSTDVQSAIEFVYSTITGVVLGDIPDGSIVAAKLASGAVTSAKIDALAVVTAALADLAVTTAKLADGAVTSDKLASAAVTLAKMASASVGTSQLVNNCVTEGKLANGAVVEARIADEAVSEAKLSTTLAAKINGKQGEHATVSITLESGASSWTKSVSGVTAINTVITSCDTTDDDSFTQWTNCGVRCYEQSAGQLKFKARSTTSAAVKVNVVIFN